MSSPHKLDSEKHRPYEINNKKSGVPAVAQWDRWHLWIPGMQVQSPAWHSGLRIGGCCSCGVGCNCGSALIPGPETPYVLGPSKKKQTSEQVNKKQDEEAAGEEGLRSINKFKKRKVE